VAGLGFAFLRFIGSLAANRANLGQLSFSGVLFLATLLLILFIFTAFWVEVKLIPTLWLLLFLSPVIFFLSRNGLAAADCSIGTDFKPTGVDPKDLKRKQE
jgi:O-antigen/teichoic acid export membrane protein